MKYFSGYTVVDEVKLFIETNVQNAVIISNIAAPKRKQTYLHIHK